MSFRRQPLSDRTGLLLVEILLAVAIFGMISLITLSAFVYGRQSIASSGDNSRAAEIATSTSEALQNMAQSSYAKLATYSDGTTYYLDASSSQWALTTTPTKINSIFTPSLVFSTGPKASRQVDITVTWPKGASKQGKLVTTTYLADWQTAASASIKTGLLVYANGGTSTSLIDYRFLQSDGFWTSPQPLPSVGASNRVARSVKLYSAQTGKAKVVIARFYDGRNQYIYGFPWNGTAWATPQLLDSWRSSDALDSGNFSGTFLANGTFIAVYSNNTNQPRYNTYSSGSWGAQQALPSISYYSSDTPTSMIIRARPGSNEAMLALLGENYRTLTAYYSNNSWSNYTTQATDGTSNGTHNVDFAWSKAGGSIYGALVYTTTSSQRTPTVRIFTADGQGNGSWGTPLTSLNQPYGSIVISVTVAGQASGSPNFIVCDKDYAYTQHIYCYTASPAGINRPDNYMLSSTTSQGGQQTMELGFEDAIGNIGLSGYADGGRSAKLKRWLSATNSWDATPLAAPNAAANIGKTRLIPEPGLNDAMLLQIDDQNNLYSIMYDGNNNAFYTQPTGYSWTIHNANGPSIGAKWFDFGWDN